MATALDTVMQTWAANPPVEYSFHTPQPSNIVMCAGGVEMLKVAPDGFYVRGVKVTADDKEAETVYNAFKAWMMWAKLNER